MRKTTLLGASVLALALAGWTAGARAQDKPADTAPAADAAPAAPAKTHHHHKAAAKPDAGDAATDDLNAKSLDDAKAGKSFAPPTPTPDTSKAAAPKKAMTHKHSAKKKAAPAADAPAADAPK